MSLLIQIKNYYQETSSYLNSRKFFVGSCYNGINELPLWNWHQLLDESDYTYLIKKGKVVEAQLKESYYTVMDEYRAEMGENEEYIRYMKLIVQLHIAENDVYFGNKFAQNTVNMRQSDLNEYKNKKQRTRNEEMAMVSKYMGRRIDPKVESLGAYCGYIKEMQSNVNN